MMLRAKTDRLTQPGQAVNIADEWRNKGLIFADCPAWTPSGAITNTASVIASGGMLGIRIGATGARRTHHFPRNVCEFANDGTLIIVARRFSTHSSYPMLFGSANYATAANAGRGGLALFNSTGGVYAFYRNAADSGWIETAGSSWALDTIAVWGMRKSGANLTLWRDGTQMLLNASATAGAAQPATNDIGYGVQTGSTPAANADVYLAAWAGVALSNADMLALGKNPWQALNAEPRTYYISAAAPGGFQAAWARNANTVIQAVA